MKEREERGVKTCMRERRLCVRCVVEREREGGEECLFDYKEEKCLCV